ncbi:hypothetical protein ACFL2V_15125 [Pseudomonadota bacterium]
MGSRLHCYLVIFLLITLQTGCSTSLVKEGAVLSAATQARFADISPEDAVKTAEQNLNAAFDNEIAYYAPANTRKAQDALKEAQHLLEEKKASKDQIIQLVTIVEEAITAGSTNKAIVIDVLADSLSMKESLDDISAAEFSRRKYNKLANRLSGLISLIEKGDQEAALAKQPPLLEDMGKFEIEAIIHNALNPAYLALEDADDHNADDLAEVSFEKAEALYEHAKEFIHNNPRDKENVDRLAKESLVEALHAKYVAITVKILQKIPRDEMEPIVLAEESRLGYITKALEHSDIHDRALNDQALTLAKSVSALVEERNSLQIKIETQTTSAETLSQEIASLREKADKQEAQLTNKESEISQLNDEKQKLLAQVTALNAELATQKESAPEPEENTEPVANTEQEASVATETDLSGDEDTTVEQEADTTEQ